MPFHDNMTQAQWMGIAGALQNLGGTFGRNKQGGQGNPMMLQALQMQTDATKKKEWQDMLAKMATPAVGGSQYASAAGPTNLVPPSLGGQAPVGQPMPSQMAQAPGQQPRLTSQQAQMLGLMGPKQGASSLFSLLSKKPTQRQIKNDQNSVPRFVDTGERAFEDVTADPSKRPLETTGVGGTFTIPAEGGDGTVQVQAHFNKREGQHYYRDRDGKLQPLPFDAKKVTPTSQTFNKMKPGEQLKLSLEMNNLERGTRQLYRYLGNVGKGGQGMELLADRWVAKLKTIFSPFLDDNGKLDDAQIASLMQSGQIQGLLGAFRKEVVGGGVMTEQDALRVLMALGGDFSATRNNEVVRKLLRNILEDRLATYNEVYLPAFNEQGRLKRKSFKDKPELQLELKYFSDMDRVDDAATNDLENMLKQYDQ